MRRLLALPLLLAAAVPASAQDLPATIAAALRHAPDLAEADAQAAAASARVDQARAERNPRVSVDASLGAGRIDNGGFFGLPAADVTPLTLQGVAELPLWTGGRTSAAIDQAQGGVDSARLGVRAARLQTIVRAVSAYTGVLTSRQLEARFIQLTADLSETVRTTRLRFRAGEVASSDVAEAEARHAEADAALAMARGRRISAEAAYQRLTGAMPGVLAPLPDLPPTPPTLGEALDDAQRASPSLGQARAAVRSAAAGARAARAEAMPTVGAFAETAHVRDQFFPGYRADSVVVGVRGRWTLWSGGRVRAHERAADADMAASEARLRGTDDALAGQVIDAWQALVTARETVTASKARQRAAAEALRGTKLEAKVGAKPTLAVLDAERESVAADAALLQAEATQTIAAWQLDALTDQMPL